MKAHHQLLLAGLLSVAGGCATSDASQHMYELPPGAQHRSAETSSRLRDARAALGPDYTPRTEHRAATGAARFVNRLILETSPYLLQHAHNPVDWHSWGDEAFATAQRLDRPILLSVGYATCHWCHVMERESFEDLEIARFINQHFVAIKVDREERPDVDAVFMSAVQMMTGRGGWPMTVFLTPGGEPFYGGTYFPARDGDRGATVGFLTLLDRIRAGYDGSRGEVLAAGERLTAAIRRQLESSDERAPKLPTTEVIDSTAASFQQRFDAVHGGTRGAPKFPSTLPLRLLLRHHERTGSADSLTMVETTLERMARGGIYDQVGGGFHRYATDGRWLVPHFEKMLYDNALLVVAYLEAFQATGRSDFAATAQNVLDYLVREMSAADGGFYSATDADSPAPGGHDEEGLFFTWTPAELESVLGGEPSRILAAYFAVAANGNFEGRSILHRPQSTAAVAEQLQLTADEVSATVTAALPELYAERSKRQPPLLDDKVLTAWNGLAISAFASAAAVLDNPAYALRAEQAGEFLWQHLRPIVPDGGPQNRRLMRSYRTGRANEAAVLEDYAFVIAGYLDLYETTHRPLWLDRARQLQTDLDTHYAAPGGGYYRTADDAEKLLAREIPTNDGAIPSGNSIAALNLLRLAALTDDDAYRATADSWLLTLAERLQTTPTALTELQLALDFRHARVLEVVIVAPEAEGWQPFLDLLRKEFLPAKVVVATTIRDAAEHARSVPLLTGKIARDGQATAYLCEQGVCQLPTTDPGQFAEQLAAWPPVHDGSGNVQ